jgi:hypothetical protein
MGMAARMGTMPYEYDEQARQEAAGHQVSQDEAARLRVLCDQKAKEFGREGVRSHCVRFSVTAWDEPLGHLPPSVPRGGRICRGDVLDIGEQVRAGKLPVTDLFTASFIWGTGMTGYGPRRYRDIIAAAGTRLEPSLQHALTEVNRDEKSPDPIAGYAQLYGGYDYDHRAPAGQGPWSRLNKFGPAFFTKFLYFSTPGALILDNRLANAVYKRGKLPYLVTQDGRSQAWTPYRYAVYLHWMRQTARTVGVSSEMLEATLFQPPADPLGEQDAAD